MLIVEKQAARIEMLEARVAELEARLNLDSDNSHKPPSSDNPFTKAPKSQRERSGKKVGGQPGHHGSTLKRTETPDKVITHPVACCCGCGIDISSEKSSRETFRQVFDIPKIGLQVTEHRAEVKDCPHCGKRNTAEFPAGVENHTQYGPNLASLVVSLKANGIVSYERIEELVFELTGLRLSQATMVGMLKNLNRKLAPFEPWIKERLLAEPVLHADETGLRIDGILNWFHSVSNARYSWFAVHEKRGGQAMRAIGVLTKFQGILIHDFWKSYLDFPFRHGLCNAHLLRELVFQYEELKQDWAWHLGGLLKRGKQDKESGVLNPEKVAAYRAEYGRVLELAYQANPMPETPPGKKGRKRKGKTLCLLDRFRDYRDGILLFLDEAAVPFTNNQAERDIRMVKVHQKVSGTFRSKTGAIAFCRIMSFISTAKKMGKNACQAIADVWSGERLIWAAE